MSPLLKFLLLKISLCIEYDVENASNQVLAVLDDIDDIGPLFQSLSIKSDHHQTWITSPGTTTSGGMSMHNQFEIEILPSDATPHRAGQF